MKSIQKFLSIIIITACLTISGNIFFPHLSSSSAQTARVISLTQTGCQFVETESKDYNYQPKSASDCKRINSETINQRKSGFKPMSLSAGKYVFRVENKNVPYPLGFYLRGQGASQVFLPKVSGGGLDSGKTIDYAVELKKGKYYISCPLNPTPDYEVIVR